MSIPELLKAIDLLPRVMHLEIDGKHYQKTYKHEFFPPPNSADLYLELGARLCVRDPIYKQGLEPLYQYSNGMKLFHSESENDDSGSYFIPPVEFYPLERIAAETAYMQSRALDEMDLLEYDPPIYLGGLVIGEASNTGNPFVLVRWGELAGKIVYADHDPDENDWQANPFAESLPDLLRQIALPPHTALCNLCGADRIWF